MAQAKDLKWRYIDNTALPYVSNRSVISDNRPHFVDGANVLTSIRGYVERRPGLAQFRSVMGLTRIERIFTWERWNGDIYLMLCDVAAASVTLYKTKIYSASGGATDSAQFAVYTSVLTPLEPMDMTVANDTLFFTGADGFIWKYKPLGTGVGAVPVADRSPDGIGMLAAPPTTALNAGTLDATVGYRYVFTQGNSVTGHVSSPYAPTLSTPSLSTGPFTNQDVTVSGTTGTDLQVDEVHVYRTTDGGGGIYFELPNSPIASPGASSAWNIVDAAPDETLQTVRAPDPGINDGAPQGVRGLAWFANRLWTFKDNAVYFSGWEEVDNGVPEESWPVGNTFTFPEPVTGLVALPDVLIVFLSTRIYRILGDSLDTFTRSNAFTRMGARNRNTSTGFGRLAAWFDSGDVIRITDGISNEELSVDIRPDLFDLDHDNASITYHSDGKNHWLITGDGTGGDLWVYDLDTEQWMPRWEIEHTAVASVLTAPGRYDFLVGAIDGNGDAVLLVLTADCSFTDFTDSCFDAFLRTSLIPIIVPSEVGKVSDLEYVSLEYNTIAPTTVAQTTDDDPAKVSLDSAGVPVAGSSNYTVLTAVTDPVPLRSQGVNLKEKWWYSRQPAARRVAIDLFWECANTNFRLYTVALGYREMT